MKQKCKFLVIAVTIQNCFWNSKQIKIFVYSKNKQNKLLVTLMNKPILIFVVFSLLTFKSSYAIDL